MKSIVLIVCPIRAFTRTNNDSFHWRANALHDNVIKWKYSPRYWPLVRGIHRSPLNSPHKGQWRGALMFSLICAWINCWVNNREAGDLRRHRSHYDVIVMYIYRGRDCSSWSKNLFTEVIFDTGGATLWWPNINPFLDGPRWDPLATVATDERYMVSQFIDNSIICSSACS